MSVTLLLTIVTFLVSYQAFQRPTLIERYKHHPYSESRRNEYYRMLTSGFLHGSWLHLLINLFVFYSFGSFVEQYFELLFGGLRGKIYFFLIYLTTIVLADLSTFLKHRDNPAFASIGASGAVSGILFISVLFDPWNPVYLYAVIPIPGIIAALLFVLYSSWASRHRHDMIDHDAHLYGGLFGFALTVLLRPELLMIFFDKLTNI